MSSDLPVLETEKKSGVSKIERLFLLASIVSIATSSVIFASSTLRSGLRIDYVLRFTTHGSKIETKVRGNSVETRQQSLER